MDKETLLRVINSPTTESIINLIKDYCITEHKKPLDATITFISIITQTPFFYTYYEVAKDYYKKKYNIIEVKDINNNTILTY